MPTAASPDRSAIPLVWGVLGSTSGLVLVLAASAVGVSLLVRDRAVLRHGRVSERELALARADQTHDMRGTTDGCTKVVHDRAHVCAPRHGHF